VFRSSVTWHQRSGRVLKFHPHHVRVQAVRQHKLLRRRPDLVKGRIPAIPQALLPRADLLHLQPLPQRRQLFRAPVVALFRLRLRFVLLAQLTIRRCTNIQRRPQRQKCRVPLGQPIQLGILDWRFWICSRVLSNFCRSATLKCCRAKGKST